MKKRILIDLDVITIAKWLKADERKKEALLFLERVRKGEFDVYTPYTLIELLSRWKHTKLVEDILGFYSVYSKNIINANLVLELARKARINLPELTKNLVAAGVKEEDAILVLISSLFDLDFLVTMNRKHLKNMAEKINRLMIKNKLRPIRIVFPNEI
ncbi:MAG: hypothetical protein HY515_03655 [Candidatus Aenigmarchaeota archaeon]|nr:hypothetical protein [Candidatus Aenigmarchaeota archaeon]